MSELAWSGGVEDGVGSGGRAQSGLRTPQSNEPDWDSTLTRRSLAIRMTLRSQLLPPPTLPPSLIPSNPPCLSSTLVLTSLMSPTPTSAPEPDPALRSCGTTRRWETRRQASSCSREMDGVTADWDS